MSYHFLCKRGIRPARTEQFLVLFYFELINLRHICRTNMRFPLYRFNVTWSDDGGIARTSHQEYIQKCNDLFYLSVKRMIDRGVTVNQELARNELYLEVLQHLHAANARCQGFHGRVEVLQQIEELVTSGTDQPIVVFGASGCGKTSVMAKCANLVSFR